MLFGALYWPICVLFLFLWCQGSNIGYGQLLLNLTFTLESCMAIAHPGTFIYVTYHNCATQLLMAVCSEEQWLRRIVLSIMIAQYHTVLSFKYLYSTVDHIIGCHCQSGLSVLKFVKMITFSTVKKLKYSTTVVGHALAQNQMACIPNLSIISYQY